MNFETLLFDLGAITDSLQEAAGRSVARLLSVRNWLIGAYLVEYEQTGEDRAAYGDRLFPRLAAELDVRGYKGLGVSSLKNCRQVTLTWPGLEIRHALPARFGSDFPKRQASGVFGLGLLRRPVSASSRPEESKRQTPGVSILDSGSSATEAVLFPSVAQRAKKAKKLEWQDSEWVERLFSTLSFSHLLELSRIDDLLKRSFYELHCLKEGWAVREFQRQRNSLLYERVGLSKDRDAVLALVRNGGLVTTPSTEVRDPYVLEFLGLKPSAGFGEADLEQALLDHLQEFLLELGRDFCFVDRQFRVTVGNVHHHLDLLFFHRGLRSLVAIDLKVGDFEPAHAGQMSFYLNYLAEHATRSDENPPVGILLCAGKDSEVVRYATAGLADSLFVSRYMLELPTEEELVKWLQAERALLEQNLDERG